MNELIIGSPKLFLLDKLPPKSRQKRDIMEKGKKYPSSFLSLLLFT